MPIDALELGANDEADDSGVQYLECDAVTTAAVEMFDSADLEGTSVALPEGALVHVYAFNERCAYGEWDGHRGFVALRYLKKSS